MASSKQHHTKYDVFLSFRGSDTRLAFTDHLYEALVRAGICTFRDDDDIKKGHELKPEIDNAIKNSRASIVVFSENYAVSRWCLEELSLIHKQKEERDHYVLPIFYHVEPSDVRNHRKKFDIKAKEGSKWTEDSVNRWKAALLAAGGLKGIATSGPETKLIAEIVGAIIRKLDLKLLSTPTNLIGMETRAKDINSWLKNEQSSVKLVAIYGMGGAGKTTLAQYLYNSNKENFESICFLEKIGERSKERNGLLELQKQLLSDISGGMNERISNVFEGTPKIVKILESKKVLIVLDDINELKDLEALLGTEPFHTKSKVILTTRFQDIKELLRTESWSYVMFPLNLMDEQESLALFSYHAFGSNIPMDGFQEFTVEIAKYCEGNPLALKLLGRSLIVSKDDKTITEMWKSRLRSLKSMKGDLDRRIQVILQTSFDSLPLNYEKELFLHIACFFVGEDANYVGEILEHDYHAKTGIMTLINRCLLSISQSGELMMHQLLQDMGRNIARIEDPAQRSRVWLDDESYILLKDGEGSKNIEALSLNILKLDERILPFETDSVVKMKKLKLLRLNYVELKGTYDGFSELRNLRWLCWHGYDIKTMPSSMWMSSLVVLDMRKGHLTTFEPPEVMDSLKILNLSESTHLARICNLSRLPNLEALELFSCFSLTHVCKTDLKRLITLNLRGCTGLWNKSHISPMERLRALATGARIPNQPLFSLPRSLKKLNLQSCNLKYNTDFRVALHAESFVSMNLRLNTFELLPDKIDLKTLRALDLFGCHNLKSLQCLPSQLEELSTSGCISLKKITFQSARYQLKTFWYDFCPELSEVQGLFKIVPIEKLNEAHLRYIKWIRAFQHQEVKLVGDEITKLRKMNIQMLYEYGIRSTFLIGINAPHVQYTKSPLVIRERRNQGLHVSLRYQILNDDENNDRLVLLAKVEIRKSTTKAHTWVYNPVVYCKPRVGEVVEWLSYWPIGNMLDVGDMVSVHLYGEDENMIVTFCGLSLVDEVEDNTMEWKEVIGGDLSKFEMTTGGYYLCRHDLFGSETSSWLKLLFGDGINYDSDSREWRKCHKTKLPLSTTITSEKPNLYRDTHIKAICLTGLQREISFLKKMEMKFKFGFLAINSSENGTRLIIVGYVDALKAESHVRGFEKMARLQSIEYSRRINGVYLRAVCHIWHTIIMLFLIFKGLFRHDYITLTVGILGIIQGRMTF